MATKIMLEAFFPTRFHPGMRIVYCTKGAQGPFCLGTVSPVSNGTFCPSSQGPDSLSKELFIKTVSQCEVVLANVPKEERCEGT